jgi:hypothetical protein
MVTSAKWGWGVADVTNEDRRAVPTKICVDQSHVLGAHASRSSCCRDMYGGVWGGIVPRARAASVRLGTTTLTSGAGGGGARK